MTQQELKTIRTTRADAWTAFVHSSGMNEDTRLATWEAANKAYNDAMDAEYAVNIRYGVTEDPKGWSGWVHDENMRYETTYITGVDKSEALTTALYFAKEAADRYSGDGEITIKEAAEPFDGDRRKQ